jgi:hypothetical protein
MSTPDHDRSSDSRHQQEPRVRTSEYFLSEDGIDLEVIKADLARYLGRDASVRSGTYTVNWTANDVARAS